MDDRKRILPLLPLRDIVVFPRMSVPLFVGRDRSVAALEAAQGGEGLVLLAAQVDPGANEPTEEEIHLVGTVSRVLQMVRLPDQTVKVLVEGVCRARVAHFLPNDPYFKVSAEDLDEEPLPAGQGAEAYLRALHASFEAYAKASKKIPAEAQQQVAAIADPAVLSDAIPPHLPLRLQDRQELLETLSVPERIERLMALLESETEILDLERRIKGRVKKQMERTQREFYLNEQMRAIQKELGHGEEGKSEVDELEEKVRSRGMTKEAEGKALKELRKLRMMSAMSAEATVSRSYVDWLVALPWTERTEDRIDLDGASRVLDEDHHGLEKVKERILEYLAVRKLVDHLKGPILCFVGPPGVGKTSLARSIARAMGRRFVRMSLGGVRDEAEIRGHRRTYIGALPGKILQQLRKAGTANPLFLLDEIDKMSTDFRGDPSSALLEVLDPEQNHAFNDHYLDVDYDLSHVMFITTANTLHGIPPPLQDRMEILRLSGYTEEEKLHIARGHLVPKKLEEHGLSPEKASFTDAAILEVVRRYTREAGVRSLEREIASVLRKVAREVVRRPDRGRYVVTPARVRKLLGVPRFRHGEKEDAGQVGLATGLAWTEFGGELLLIEAMVMPGTGKQRITGKLGEVMQESAMAALSYIRSRADRLGLDRQFHQKSDVHIHVPEGAIPKDGPSAGITMATAVASALLRVPVRSDLAMTGEITLRGRVLPVGGVKEKVLAAHRAGIGTVILPAENERDLSELPPKVRSAIRFLPVSHMDEVLEAALDRGEAAAVDRYGAAEEGPPPATPPKDGAPAGDEDVLKH